MTNTTIDNTGQRAERRVLDALATLPAPWQIFPTVEWRVLRDDGEATGEADVVVFHPEHGLVVFEIKAGAVEVRHGEWFYASGRPMKQSPFSQARRNRYALAEKLSHRLGKVAMDALTLTHAAWFPDLHWLGPLPGAEPPAHAFLFDRGALSAPEPALLQLFKAANPAPAAWNRWQQQALRELLAPDCRMLVPLAVRLDDALAALQTATDQQLAVLRMLRTQPRLLVEGCAGSGKTQLAVCLAREHAALGKSVLLTCFNRNLAESLAAVLADVSGVTVMNFHELVRTRVLAAGGAFLVPEPAQQRVEFFRDRCPELLMQAVELTGDGFDTLIVDEGADFIPTWWVALAALGRPKFAWYCFFDRQQSIFQADDDWTPPFNAAIMTLDINLRNTRPIGEQAAAWGNVGVPAAFRVDDGIQPVIQYSEHFIEMGRQLRGLLHQLIRRERIAPERIVVLSPYRHSNPQSTWSAGLTDVDVSVQMSKPLPGVVRVGAIQGFKGLEADVVILAGLDKQACAHPVWLYVGASRARVALYALFLAGALGQT